MRLGPISGATLIVRDLKRSLAAYVGELGLANADSAPLSRQRALDMGDAALIDAPCARLRSAISGDAPWLTLIEAPAALPGAPFTRRGWLALGLLVVDLSVRVARLTDESWQVLDDAVDHAIDPTQRTHAVKGPDGEVLYLHPSRAVPALHAAPVAPGTVERLNAAVLGANDRERALGFYEGLGLVARWRLSARSPAPDHPLAIGQLRGDQLIEIHALPSLPAADSALRSGIRMLSFARSTAGGRRLAALDDPSARILAGPEGEAIELV